MWEDFAISIGVSALLSAIKNPAKAESLRRVLRKLYFAIKVALPDIEER